jgi:hypothetical protein
MLPGASAVADAGANGALDALCDVAPRRCNEIERRVG